MAPRRRYPLSHKPYLNVIKLSLSFPTYYAEDNSIRQWEYPLFLSRGKIIPVAIGDVVDFCHVHRILLPHCLCNTEISILKAASGQHAGKWVGGCSMEHKRDRCGYFIRISHILDQNVFTCLEYDLPGNEPYLELDAFTHMTVIAGRLGGLGGTNVAIPYLAGSRTASNTQPLTAPGSQSTPSSSQPSSSQSPAASGTALSSRTAKTAKASPIVTADLDELYIVSDYLCIVAETAIAIA